MAGAELRGKTWRAWWRDGQGHKKGQGGFHSRSAAIVFADEEERRSRAGHVAGDRNMTWGEWRPQWLALRDVSESSEKTTGYVRERYVTPRWKDVPLGGITTHEVRGWVRQMSADGLSAHTVIKAYHQLSNSLKLAIEAQVLTSSPCVGIKLPTPTPGKAKAFSEDEIWDVVSALSEPYKFAIIFLVFTGTRFGEMAGLHWGNVHEDDRQLYIADTWDRHGRQIRPLPKDGEARWVPIPDQVLKMLERPADWRTPCGLEHEEGPRSCMGQLVIPGPRGAALDSHNVRERHWLPALRKAGLAHGRQHDLRHTYITWLIEAGMTAEQVARLVGHSSTYITRKYTHILNRDHMDQARVLLSGLGNVGDASGDRIGDTPGGRAALAHRG